MHPFAVFEGDITHPSAQVEHPGLTGTPAPQAEQFHSLSVGVNAATFITIFN